MQSVLEIRSLQVCRGKTAILRDIDWTVRPGEHWLLLGANGCGKTTLLQTITGYVMPTEGSLRVMGHLYGEYDWRELRRHIGMVSSSLSHKIEKRELPRALVAAGKSAKYNVRGWIDPDSLEQANEMLIQVDAVHLADRPWGYLSQGERQRVLVGRALIAEPSLLILDEPCAGLDPVARSRFLDFVRRITASTKISIVFVTHHVEEIFPELTHALVLAKGRVLAAGELSSVLTSENLSAAFNAEAELHRHDETYQLVLPKRQAGKAIW